MRHDTLADVLFVLNNSENIGKKTCEVAASKLADSVLKVVHKSGYIGDFKMMPEVHKFSVKLLGKINKSRAIRPRFSVKKNEYEKWENRYLPAKGFGILVVSTPKGVMNQKDAMKKGFGGKLLAYVY